MAALPLSLSAAFLLKRVYYIPKEVKYLYSGV